MTENTQNTAEYTLTTDEFAKLNMVKAHTVRCRLSAFGTYFGVRPAKLANGRTACQVFRRRTMIVTNT